MGAAFFHADGQMDMMKLIVAFRNFSNAPKNVRYTGVHCKSSMYEFRVFYANERITRRRGEGTDIDLAVCLVCWSRISSLLG